MGVLREEMDTTLDLEVSANNRVITNQIIGKIDDCIVISYRGQYDVSVGKCLSLGVSWFLLLYNLLGVFPRRLREANHTTTTNSLEREEGVSFPKTLEIIQSNNSWMG